MQKINTILLIVLLLAVGYLLIDKFSGASSDTSNIQPIEMTEKDSGEVIDDRPGVGKIAYVDLDTLNSQFAFLTDKLDLMQSEQTRQQRRFQGQAKKVEERYLTLQEDAYKMTQDQLLAAQTEMEQAQAQLQSSQEQITNELLALETSIQTELDERIDEELNRVNEKYGFDYIMAKAVGSGVLLANEEFDITKEVLAGLNATYEAEKAKD